MITIPVEIKPLLNKLIRYYRESSNNPAYESKNFIYDENGIKICDLSTLSRMSNNKTNCKDNTYFQFCKKLNMPFKYDVTLNNILIDTNKSLLVNAEVNNADKIISILEKTMLLLQPFKHAIIYNEFYEIYNILYIYYSKQEFNKEQLDKYIELYDILPEEIKPIFISIAYHYYTRVNIEEFISIDIIKKSLDLKTNSIISLYLVSAYYLRTNQNTILKSIVTQGLNLCKKEKNNYYIIRFYNMLSYLYRFNNPKLAIHYLTLCIANYKSSNDSYSTLAAFYHNMAHLAYDRKDYSSIVYIYKKHLYNDTQFLKVFFYLLIKSIEETTNEHAEIKRILAIANEHSFNNKSLYQASLDLFTAIYSKQTPKTIFNCISKVFEYNNYLCNEPILKSIMLEISKKVCLKNNCYDTYLSYLKLFQ